jgi:hypothetical protein
MGSEENFEGPTGIAVDELNQQAFVNDKANNNIQVFTIPDDPLANIEYSGVTNNDFSQEEDSKNDDDDDSKNDDDDDDSKNDDDDDDFEDKDGDGYIDCKGTGKNVDVGSDDPYDLDRDGDGTGCDA